MVHAPSTRAILSMAVAALCVVAVAQDRRSAQGAAPLDSPAPAQGRRIQRVYALAPAEGVFAYSRISPDGTQLAYSSEAPPARPGLEPVRTVRVVELATRKVLFEHGGIDAYFSPDGRRIIFLSMRPGDDSDVCLVTLATNELTCNVAPVRYGDYFSWARYDGRDRIATINSFYYYLEGPRAVMPPARVAPCPGIGVGARPLISKDGRQLTAFFGGTIVVRNVADCEGIVRTNIGGGKADFSWDGRYIAFHAQKPDGEGYEIRVVDLVRRRTFAATDLPGSSYFPSWTQDGRLSFRYDSAEYRGFVLASDFMPATTEPLPDQPVRPLFDNISWQELFPRRPRPAHAVTVVLVWAPWNAHSPDALLDLQKAARRWTADRIDVGVFAAPEPSSFSADIARMKASTAFTLPELALDPDRVIAAGAENYVPMVLLFEGDRLRERRLGAQTPAMLDDLVSGAFAGPRRRAAE
jgi:hypothetical protein